MTLWPNSKPLPRVVHLRRQSRHLPTSKPKTADPTAAVGRRKSTRLSIKSTKNSSDPTSHPVPQKLPIKNTLHNDHPPTGRSPKDISQALKNPSLTDDKLIVICAEETPSDAKASPARDPDNRGTQPPPAQETATSPSALFPTKDQLTLEGQTPRPPNAPSQYPPPYYGESC